MLSTNTQQSHSTTQITTATQPQKLPNGIKDKLNFMGRLISTMDPTHIPEHLKKKRPDNRPPLFGSSFQ